MNQNRIKPVAGTFYRHFKNKLYQVVALARDSETGEELVVYQALYGAFQIWVRPLAMFMEEVDREKYPDAAQRYRFEQVILDEAAVGVLSAGEPAETLKTSAFQELNPVLMDFFDAMDKRNYDAMLECLAKLKSTATEKEIGHLCMAWDMDVPKGDVPEQLAAIKSQIQLRRKYDGERLR